MLQPAMHCPLLAEMTAASLATTLLGLHAPQVVVVLAVEVGHLLLPVTPRRVLVPVRVQEAVVLLAGAVLSACARHRRRHVTFSDDAARDGPQARRRVEVERHGVHERRRGVPLVHR